MASTLPNISRPTIAAMEGLFKTETGAPMVIIGQPDAEHQRIDNPIVVNKVLEFPGLRNHNGRGAGPERLS